MRDQQKIIAVVTQSHPTLPLKVIIEKSRGEVSLMEQDSIENVS